jgi:predicted ATPase
MALTLASSIEGLRRLVPEGTLRADADQATIDSLVAHIEERQGASRLRDGALDAVIRADAVSVQRALYMLADRGAGTRAQVKSWIKIRDSVMHGKLVSPLFQQRG